MDGTQPATLFIRDWRKFRRLTIEQLAERLGLSKATVSKIENRLQSPTLVQLEAFADALACSAVDLITRDPAEADGIWSIWVGLGPAERRRVIEIAKALKRAG